MYPSGLSGPLSAIIVLLVRDVIGHFWQSALVVPSFDDMFVEYGGVHLGLARVEADLHRCRGRSCFHRVSQSLSCIRADHLERIRQAMYLVR